ncbi:hypothetical protein AURDEDRAFT_126729 [Auricularia subglabra TFB-10046 SS5]|nr:hypothetical protein AURDEDRAFT_126729 [Auricularia subglabra TFB-10046 SS5]
MLRWRTIHCTCTREDNLETYIQRVHWNQRAPTILLTGSYDRTERTFDIRSPGLCVGARLGADVEAVRWDSWEDGNAEGAPPALWTLAAHDGADKSVEVWNITTTDGKQHVSPGKVFSETLSPDDPLVLAATSSKARLQVWDLGANAGARRVFAPRFAAAWREVRERDRAAGGFVGVQSDGEGDESADDE